MKKLVSVVFAILFLIDLTTFAWPTFYHYPSTSTSSAKVYNKSELLGSPFENSNQTIFVVHGWKSSQGSWFIADVRNALLRNVPENNIIVVDWRNGAKDGYSRSVQNTKVVGKGIADFIVKNNLTLSLTYCVGHSLGAHICGFAGKALGGRMGRITGLDPAGPSFRDQRSKDRLMKTDALFVDVIHTTQVAGTKISSGHLDFFPNFDNNPFTDQPECDGKGLECNHRSAIVFFVYSTLKKCQLTTQLCIRYKTESGGTFNGCRQTISTSSPMGYYANKSAPIGNYVIKTKKYC